jgi:predicted branched-subunit amino acid permease
MFNEVKRNSFLRGFKEALPIFWGYFAVSFSIGITASKFGITWFQAGLMSILNHTSAGQAAAIIMIGNNDSYFNVGVSQLVFNLRYMLMSTALALKLRQDTKLSERLLMSCSVTDEIFGISIMKDAPINAWFSIGALCMASPGWVLGTILGVVMGQILSSQITAALSVVLYSMFIAVIFPQARKKKFLLLVIFVSMLSSFLFSILPYVSTLSYGTKAIVLTIAISAIFAWLKPVEEENNYA